MDLAPGGLYGSWMPFTLPRPAPASRPRAVAFAALAALAIASAVACGSQGEVGDACDTRGSTDECTDGAICSQSGAGSVCLTICSDDDTCGENEECNGVEGSSTKACRPKK